MIEHSLAKIPEDQALSRSVEVVPPGNPDTDTNTAPMASATMIINRAW